MRTTAAYADLLRMGQPVVETQEAAVRLGTTVSNAGHQLRAAERAGLVVHLSHGLWALDRGVAPDVVAPYLTSPFPAYVSLWSALARHDMIEQIPAQTYVASLARTRTVATAVGGFSIHHVAAELFTGFEGSPELGYLATAEKALFDSVYVRAPRGGRSYFPELVLPVDFAERQLELWLERIPSPRMRTLVARGLDDAVGHAGR